MALLFYQVKLKCRVQVISKIDTHTFNFFNEGKIVDPNTK